MDNLGHNKIRMVGWKVYCYIQGNARDAICISQPRCYNDSMYYFAYGSNMNEGQMRKRCPEARLFKKGVLRDYRLDFTISDPNRWNGGGCADVVASTGSEVWGIVYELSSIDFARLDKAEGPRYQKILKSIIVDDSTSLNAELYEVIDKAKPIPPSAEYLNRLKEAVDHYQFPESYRLFLKTLRQE